MSKKKVDKRKTSPLIKNPQFLSNQADILGTRSSHMVNIFTEFHEDWTTIVDFLSMAKF